MIPTARSHVMTQLIASASVKTGIPAPKPPQPDVPDMINQGFKIRSILVKGVPPPAHPYASFNTSGQESRANAVAKRSTRLAASKQLPVTMPCHPFGAGEMALEGPPCSIRFALRVEVQHDPRDLVPVGTFRIRIEHAHVVKACSSS